MSSRHSASDSARETLERRLVALDGADLHSGSLRGIEKESLRVSPDGYIADTPHPEALGSALTNKFITTDFSEALLEFITPPVPDVRHAIQFLCDLHQFTCSHIDDEIMWAMSMPCMIRSEADIPLAQYGSSNIGRMKTTYRRGLGYRYGRHMQAISGIHYNYSVPESFWPLFQETEQHSGDPGGFQSAHYLGVVRNVRRFGWLLMYLFGASPAVCRSFLQGRTSGLNELDYGTVYGPHATSLRMSDLGYHNIDQARLQVSANTLDQYITDLDRAIRTENADYREIGVLVDGIYRQINASELQIENEFYSTIRPKRVARSGERPTLALGRRGIEYVELRILDVNPFDPVGINQREARFVEAFLLYCLFRNSPPISDAEAQANQRNQALVAQRGREPGLALNCDGRDVALLDWGREIIEGVIAVSELLDSSGASGYRDAAREYARSLEDPEQTPSARLLAELRETGEPLFRYAMRLSTDYTDYFRQLPPELNAQQDKFVQESRASHERQAELEAADTLDFPAFLERYFE
ncbi:MAG: glutamate--cysteine ligase [Gammaproteobacteria bacterium]|nr:glutamate--cysteine ligase [Gammaproteobacteria bacterium]